MAKDYLQTARELAAIMFVNPKETATLDLLELAALAENIDTAKPATVEDLKNGGVQEIAEKLDDGAAEIALNYIKNPPPPPEAP